MVLLWCEVMYVGISTGPEFLQSRGDWPVRVALPVAEVCLEGSPTGSVRLLLVFVYGFLAIE